jgi:hypothetical protein
VLLCAVVPLPPGTYPLVVNNNKIKKNKKGINNNTLGLKEIPHGVTQFIRVTYAYLSI